jgi:hypothetical protein
MWKNNRPPQDTIDLLSDKPDWMKSWATEAHKHRGKIGIVIGQPRSGTTLFLRLMHLACLTKMVGERHADFYNHLLEMESLFFQDASYGYMINTESQGLFPDMHLAETKDSAHYRFSRILSESLFGVNSTFEPGFCKVTTLGFGKGDLVAFVNMIRKYFGHLDLKIIFMSRDHDSIIESMITTEGAHKELYRDENNINLIRAMLVDQKKQMQEAYEFESDSWVSYEKFITEPTKYLKLINPIYIPNEKAVARVMGKKIRASAPGFDSNESFLTPSSEKIKLHQVVYNRTDHFT